MRLTGCPVDELGLEPTGIIPVPPMGARCRCLLN